MRTFILKDYFSFNKIIIGDLYRLLPGIFSELLGGFIIATLLVKFLPPQAMGIYTLLYVAQTQISALSSGWLKNSIIRFLPEKPYFLKTFLSISIKFILILGGLSIVLVPVIFFSLDDSFSFYSIFWAALLCCFSSLYQIYQVVLRGIFNQLAYSTNAFFLISIKLSCLYVFLNLFQDKVQTTFIVLSLGHVPLILWQYWKLSSSDLCQDNQGKSVSNRYLLTQSIKYGLPLSLSQFFLLFLQSGDRYILSAFLTLSEIGIYSFWMSIGFQFSRALQGFVFMIINPRLFQIYHTNPLKANTLVKILSMLYIVTLGPLLIIISFILPHFYLYIKADAQYTSHSHLLFYGMGMGFLLGLAQLFGKRFEFEKKTIIFVFASIVGLVALVSSIIFLVPLYGLNGAGISSLIGFLAYFIMIYIISCFK